MTLRTHLSRDYSEASASRLRRACRHLELLRVIDVQTKEFENTWVCEDCEGEFELISKAAPVLLKDIETCE